MIGINARYRLRERPTGVHRAAEALIRALLAADPLRYRLLFPRSGGSHAPRPPSSWNLDRIGDQLWEQGPMSRQARRAGCCVVLNPIQTSPIMHQGVKQIVVVHDLHFLHHPEWFGLGFRWWNRLVTLRALRRADHVVAISDHGLADVRRTCGIPADRSSRIYNVGPTWRGAKVGTEAHRSNLSILCVNPYQPHKNLARVLMAFRQLRNEFPQLELRLVGRPQENFSAVSELEAQLNAPGVRILGYVSDAVLAEEYDRCSLVCYASLAEGFGLPVLEAAAAGALVVTSQVPALREIAADAALFVDPWNMDGIANGLRCALRLSPERRAEFIAKGRKNLERFSAEMAVSAYTKIFTRLLHETNDPIDHAARARRRVASH